MITKINTFIKLKENININNIALNLIIDVKFNKGNITSFELNFDNNYFKNINEIFYFDKDKLKQTIDNKINYIKHSFDVWEDLGLDFDWDIDDNNNQFMGLKELTNGLSNDIKLSILMKWYFNESDYDTNHKIFDKDNISNIIVLLEYKGNTILFNSYFDLTADLIPEIYFTDKFPIFLNSLSSIKVYESFNNTKIKSIKYIDKSEDKWHIKICNSDIIVEHIESGYIECNEKKGNSIIYDKHSIADTELRTVIQSLI